MNISKTSSSDKWVGQESTIAQVCPSMSIGFMIISHIPGKEREGHFCREPAHLCGNRKSSVYGHKGGSDLGATIEESYKNPNSFIMINCVFHPTLKNGTRVPRSSSNGIPAKRLIMFAIPANSSNQSSMVALYVHQSSGCLWLQKVEW